MYFCFKSGFFSIHIVTSTHNCFFSIIWQWHIIEVARSWFVHSFIWSVFWWLASSFWFSFGIYVSKLRTFAYKHLYGVMFLDLSKYLVGACLDRMNMLAPFPLIVSKGLFPDLSLTFHHIDVWSVLCSLHRVMGLCLCWPHLLDSLCPEFRLCLSRLWLCC